MERGDWLTAETLLAEAVSTCPVDADALLWTVTRVLEARS